MKSAKLLVILYILPDVVNSCDPNYINVIEKHIVQDEDITNWLEGKFFLNMWADRQHISFSTWAGFIQCSWFHFRRRIDGVPQTEVKYELRMITYPPTYSTSYFKLYGSHREERWKSYERQGHNGIIFEKDKKNNKVLFKVYPLYVDKENGVYAYHRCHNTVKSNWWTGIAVVSDKFGQHPVGLDAKAFESVKQARDKIREILSPNKQLAKREGHAYTDPHKCTLNIWCPKTKLD